MRDHSKSDSPSSKAMSPAPTRSFTGFDEPPHLALARTAGKAYLLSLFKNNGLPKSLEKRGTPRYGPAEAHVWFGWWQGPHFITNPALLINLSAGGALVQLVDAPSVARPLWLCLKAGALAKFAKASVLEVSPTRRGDHEVRLKFEGPCTSDFFTAAINGDWTRKV